MNRPPKKDARAPESRSLHQCRKTPAFYIRIGNALNRGGFPHRAVAAYDQALKQAPGSRTALRNRALTLFGMGRIDDAARTLHRVAELAPEDGQKRTRSGLRDRSDRRGNAPLDPAPDRGRHLPCDACRGPQKKIYDRLACQDAVIFLDKAAEHFDLIVAADVLIYFGDIQPLFAATSRRLSPGGRLMVSTEVTRCHPFRLRRTGRFAHHSGYVSALAARSGFEIEKKTPPGDPPGARPYGPRRSVYLRPQTELFALPGGI